MASGFFLPDSCPDLRVKVLKNTEEGRGVRLQGTGNWLVSSGFWKPPLFSRSPVEVLVDSGTWGKAVRKSLVDLRNGKWLHAACFPSLRTFRRLCYVGIQKALSNFYLLQWIKQYVLCGLLFGVSQIAGKIHMALCGFLSWPGAFVFLEVVRPALKWQQEGPVLHGINGKRGRCISKGGHARRFWWTWHHPLNILLLLFERHHSVLRNFERITYIPRLLDRPTSQPSD